MAKGASYRVQLRRRREGRTDYQARTGMVVSGRPRLVTRPSIKNVYAQIVVAKIDGDRTVAAASSHELAKKYGWKAPTGNIPAAYLTGLLCGLKAKAAGIDEAILDLGLINPTKGARVFAVLYGVIDAGVEIPHGEEKIVKERAKGDHIARYAKELNGENPELYQAKFSKYNAAGVAPEKVAAHFSEVRNAIVASFKDAKVAPEPPSAPEPKAKPKPQAPKPEAKAAPAPKAEAKAPESKPAPKAPEAPAPKPEAKVEAPKEEAKPAKAEAKAAKEKAPATEEEAPKEKAPKAKAKAAPKEKVEEEAAPKASKGKAAKAEKTEKAPKEKAPAKQKAPAKKATKKGEKKE